MNELHTEVVEHISKRNYLWGMDVCRKWIRNYAGKTTKFQTFILFINTIYEEKEEEYFLAHLRKQ